MDRSIVERKVEVRKCWASEMIYIYIKEVYNEQEKQCFIWEGWKQNIKGRSFFFIYSSLSITQQFSQDILSFTLKYFKIFIPLLVYSKS